MLAELSRRVVEQWSTTVLPHPRPAPASSTPCDHESWLFTRCAVGVCCRVVLTCAVSCRSGAWCICWSPCNEHQLFSGDGSGAVRLWDIRRSGCRALLDFNITQRPQPTAPASTPVAQNTTGRKRTRSRDLAGHGLSGEDDGHSSRSKSAGPAVAHEGAVTGLLATQDGLSLLSSGMDHRVRLWDAGETRLSRMCRRVGNCLVAAVKHCPPALLGHTLSSRNIC